VGAQWKLGHVAPFRLDTVDPVWPENFDGFYKARLWIWSVVFTWVYRTTIDWLLRGFWGFNGVLF
jgi:hypothetical protein